MEDKKLMPGARLRDWRTARQYSVAQVAGLSGISPAMVSAVERGERFMSPERKVQLARLVGEPVDVLFDPFVDSRVA